jgi:hypothetical protein
VLGACLRHSFDRKAGKGMAHPKGSMVATQKLFVVPRRHRSPIPTSAPAHQ